MATWIFLILVVAIVFWVITAYNTLISLKGQTLNAWKQIDVQLKRRHDLIPNLLEAVKGAMNFERQTLEAVIAARAKAMSAHGVRATAQAEGELTQALGRLFALAEAYPDLKATGNKVLVCAEMTYQVEMGKEVLVDPLPQEFKPHVVWRDTFWMPDEAASIYARAQCVVSVECHSPLIAKDLIVSLGIFILLIVLATFIGVANEPKADPSDSSYLPRLEWYFLFLFKFLALYGQIPVIGKIEWLATVVIPSIGIALLTFLPLLEKSPYRHYSRRGLFPDHHGYRRPGYRAVDRDDRAARGSQCRRAGRIYDPASHRRTLDPGSGACRIDRAVRLPGGMLIVSRPGAACRSWSRSSVLLQWSP